MNAWCLFEGARPSQNGSNGNGQTTGKNDTTGKSKGRDKRAKQRQGQGNANDTANLQHKNRMETDKSQSTPCKSEYHSVWKCTEIPSTEEGKLQRKRLVEAFYAARGQRKPEQSTLPGNRSITTVNASVMEHTQRADLPGADDKDPRDHLTGTLADTPSIPIKVQMDSGADITVVTRAFVDKAMDASCKVLPTKLEAPQRVPFLAMLH
ncbi:hypothetical protein THRCLA_23430 [Thraustotheca clavata]|uniref:Uncharacterized protein n=1 Tax=Thraustotheca clavata TaxID=74557 RepID=A0A1V9Y5I1_9STRA|nr:hypothetical protein THRCLA_23430 [Thraustotheca clavata]